MAYLFTHHVPVSLLDTGIAEGVDEGHVDLELLQLGLDGGRRPHRTHHVGVGKDLGQLVASPPHILHL